VRRPRTIGNGNVLRRWEALLLVSQEAAPGVDGRTWQSYKQNLTPLAFCATSGYLVYSSLAYTGLGELVGVLVLAACTLGLAPTRGGS
jgi:hypothetical protein